MLEVTCGNLITKGPLDYGRLSGDSLKFNVIINTRRRLSVRAATKRVRREKLCGRKLFPFRANRKESGRKFCLTFVVSAGEEDLSSNYKQDSKLSFVIKAIYSFAYALHNMQQDVCGQNYRGVCEKLLPLNGSSFKVNSYVQSEPCLFLNQFLFHRTT